MKKSFILLTILLFSKSCFSFDYVLPKKAFLSQRPSLSANSKNYGIIAIDEHVMDLFELLVEKITNSNPDNHNQQEELFNLLKNLFYVRDLLNKNISLLISNNYISEEAKAIVSDLMIHCSNSNTEACTGVIDGTQKRYVIELSSKFLEKINLTSTEGKKALDFAIMHELGHAVYQDPSLKRDREGAIKDHIINGSNIDEQFKFNEDILNESKIGPRNARDFPENIKIFVNDKPKYDIVAIMNKHKCFPKSEEDVINFQYRTFTLEEKIEHDLIKEKCTFEKPMERRADLFAVKMLGDIDGALRYFEKYCDHKNPLHGSIYDEHDSPAQRIKLIQEFQKGLIDLDLATGEFIGKSVSEILNK